MRVLVEAANTFFHLRTSMISTGQNRAGIRRSLVNLHHERAHSASFRKTSQSLSSRLIRQMNNLSFGRSTSEQNCKQPCHERLIVVLLQHIAECQFATRNVHHSDGTVHELLQFTKRSQISSPLDFPIFSPLCWSLECLTSSRDVCCQTYVDNCTSTSLDL